MASRLSHVLPDYQQALVEDHEWARVEGKAAAFAAKLEAAVVSGANNFNFDAPSLVRVCRAHGFVGRASAKALREFLKGEEDAYSGMMRILNKAEAQVDKRIARLKGAL